MKNKLQTLVFVLLTVVAAIAQQKQRTHDEMQQFMIDKSFEQADYIFEAEALGANEMTRYKDSSFKSSFWYQKLKITKIYRGGKELKLGSALSLTWLDMNLRDKYHFQKAIYFAKKSDYPKPKLNEKMDNKVAVTFIDYLNEIRDSIGRKQHFGMNRGTYQFGLYFYDVENTLFKNRKNIVVPKTESIIEKKVVPLQKIEVVEKTEDTTGFGKKRALEYETQRAEADENMLRNVENMNLNDTVSLATRQEYYKYLTRNFHKTAARFKQLFIDTYKPAKKKLNFRTESSAATLASTVDMQYGIRNKTITTAVGKNF